MSNITMLSQSTVEAISAGSLVSRQTVEKEMFILKLRYEVTYPNGYGVSIIKITDAFGTGLSYGAEDDLWELAVLKDGALCYDTPITCDVLGHLTESDVIRLCKEVRSLE